MTTANEIRAIDSRLKSIQLSAGKIKNDDNAYGIWSDLVHTTSRINALMIPAGSPRRGAQGSLSTGRAPPSIVSKLQEWIQAIKSAIAALAAFLKAASYSVSVSAPLGISVSVMFSV